MSISSATLDAQDCHANLGRVLGDGVLHGVLTLTTDGPLVDLSRVEVVGLKSEGPGVVVHGCIVVCSRLGVNQSRREGCGK